MRNLMRIALEEDVATSDYKSWLAMHRQMTSCLREIRREMRDFDALGAVSLSERADQAL